MPLVLEKHKGFALPSGHSSDQGEIWTRVDKWIKAITVRNSVVNTTSDEEQYLKVYERYANNTTNSLVARATREGQNLP